MSNGCFQHTAVSLPTAAHLSAMLKFMVLWFSGRIECLLLVTQWDHTVMGRSSRESLSPMASATLIQRQ